jgi:hypothetical protein
MTTLENPNATTKPEAQPGCAATHGSEVPTPRTNEEARLCRVKSSSFGDMVGADFAQKLERENRALREGCAKIAASIGNGSAISPDASVDFLTNALADEVKLYCHDLRQQMVGLRREIQHQKNRADAHAGLPNAELTHRESATSERTKH